MVTQYYLDSSVGLRILLGRSAAAARWFDGITASPHDGVISSRLMRSGVEDIVVCTHARAMAKVAQEIGLQMLDPVTDDPGVR